MAQIGIPLTKAQKEAWIHSQDTWAFQLGEHWKGQKNLGEGAFGITGLWEWKGPENEKPEITQVVVKQTSYDMAIPEPKPWGEMDGMSEGKILQKFSMGNTRHIIKIYGGNKVGDKYYEMNIVVKIFLEFCPGGDLQQLLAVSDKSGQPTEKKGPYEEVDLWTIFYCLSLGVVAMSRGTEDFRKSGGWELTISASEQTEICHFDIKPDNLLFGFRDPEHVRLPILKIADFGEAREAKIQHLQDDEYGGIFTRRGNREMGAPEETCHQEYPVNPFPQYPLNKPRKGDCSNIFQVGCVMNCLLLGQKLNFNQPGTTLYQSQLNDTLKRGLWHHAMDLETEPVSSTYSKELRALITECLLHESLKRPPAVNLAARCERGLEDAQQATKAAGITPDNVPDRLRNLPIIPLKPPEPPNLWINDKENLEYDLAEGTFADPNMPPALMGSPGVIGSIANSLQQFSPPAQMVTSGVIAGFTSRFQTFSPPMTPPRLFGFFGGPGSGTSSSPTPAAPSRLNPAKANVNTTVNPPRMRLNLQSPKPPEPPIS